MLVPKLRFREFNDEWSIMALNDVSNIYDGTHETPEYKESGVKFISVEDIRNFDNTSKFITIDAFNKYKVRPKFNDIFMTRIGDIGTSNILKSNDDYAYYVSLSLIRNKKNINPDYLNQYIGFNNFQRELWNRTIHVAFPKKINLGEIGNCKIAVPTLQEQTKISNFLSLLDKKIELQTKKIETLKLYKKGIVLNLMKNKIKWSEYKVKDIFNITRGIVIPKIDLSEKSNDEYKYPVYSSQTFNEGILGYDKKYDFDGKYLTWTTDGANAGKVFFRNGKFRCTNVCGILYENNVKYTNELVAELLNYVTPKHVSYVGNPKLMNNVMGEIRINLPKDEIQINASRIINLFSNKIELENKKLEKLQTLKKGFMQEMFA